MTTKTRFRSITFISSLPKSLFRVDNELFIMLLFENTSQNNTFISYRVFVRQILIKTLRSSKRR